jgi:transcriptional regulator with XRE-family HTH domain
MEGQLQVVVGHNLRRLRRQLGYSQESFGEHVGWHRTFVGAVERGERNLTLRTVERLAAQLEVHPLALLFDGVAAFRPVTESGVGERPVTFAADRGGAVPPRRSAAAPPGTPSPGTRSSGTPSPIVRPRLPRPKPDR